MAREREDEPLPPEGDRPARRRRDDDDDRGDGPMGPLDKTFRDTNMVLLIIFSVCCSIIALPLGAVGFFTGKDFKAKENAKLVMIISGILVGLWLIGWVLRLTVFAARVAVG